MPVINDGVEFTNRYYRDVIDALKKANAPLHAMTVGSFYVTGDHATRERAFVLDQGTRESGGQRVTLLSPMGLNTRYGQAGARAVVAVQGGLRPAGIADSTRDT